MSTNPIDENSTPKTTGSLEELFRHHLGEEAAVPLRPMLWDQIDNSLLIRQNEIYRRRLVVTRWVAAASLLLATLAGTGWWTRRDASLGGTEVATTIVHSGAISTAALEKETVALGRRATNFGTSKTAGHTSRPSNAATTFPPSSATITSATKATNQTVDSRNAAIHRATITTGAGTMAGTYAAAQATNATDAATRNTGRNTGFGAASVRNELEHGSATTEASRLNLVARSTRTPAHGKIGAVATSHPNVQSLHSATADNSRTLRRAINAAATASRAIATATSTTAPDNASTTPAAGVPIVAGLTQAPSIVQPESLDLLAARMAALNLTSPVALPSGLAAVPVPTIAALPAARRWHFGASYTAGVFNPNINFSRAGIESAYGYNPALGSESPALTEAAAAQYRQNLRPGLSQRIALLATRHLTGHWSLSTGAEFTQASAQSASTTAFVGEQLLDLGQPAVGPLRTTDFRYRTASIPVEVRYTNPIKRGWSLYGRLGGVVSALLGVRSEVEGNPEATRTYSLTSAGMPYRRVLGSVRGGVGAQFRTSTGKWALNLGPVAEMGLVPLNAHPAQSFFAQSRSYSFGVEAGVEFGR